MAHRAAGPGLLEPLPTLLERVLKGAVTDHARREHRRSYPPVLHVGMPRGTARTVELNVEGLDHALRTDMIEAAARADLAADRVPLVWLTRMESGPTEVDLEWAAAVGSAGAELGVRLDLVVVTRRSWFDPRSGAGRSWSRIRAREEP